MVHGSRPPARRVVTSRSESCPAGCSDRAHRPGAGHNGNGLRRPAATIVAAVRARRLGFGPAPARRGLGDFQRSGRGSFSAGRCDRDVSGDSAGPGLGSCPILPLRPPGTIQVSDRPTRPGGRRIALRRPAAAADPARPAVAARAPSRMAGRPA